MDQMRQLEQELAALRMRVRRLTIMITVSACVLFAAALAPQDQVIRARGLVITDAAGRDRVVLGAPMANVTDDARLAQSIGIVVLDSMGRMNVALGAQTPLILADGRVGTRVAGRAGLTIYDPRDGKERGGIGAFEDGRANVCLDYDEGQKEAVCLAVAPADQYAAVLLNGTPTEPQYDRVVMYVGADGSGSIKVFGGHGNRGGLLLRAGEGLPRALVFDTTGMPIRDLVATGSAPDARDAGSAAARAGAVVAGDAHAAVAFAGEWRMRIDAGGQVRTALLTIEQDGANFRGTMTLEGQRLPLSNGVIDGDRISMVTTMDQGGQTMQIRLNGTVDGDRATGSMDAGPLGVASWTAERTGPGGAR
jgi:hypothetical protein